MAKGWTKHKIAKEELSDLYLNQKLSSIKIAELISDKLGYTVDDRLIRTYLDRFGIEMRGQRDALLLAKNGYFEVGDYSPMLQQEKEILTGELLSDGHLCKRCENSYPYYRHSSKYKEYLEWLAKQLPSMTFADVTKTIHNVIKKDGSNCISYRLDSSVHPELKEIYNDFYTGEEKRIPSSLKLTPTIVRHWFLGDGHCGYNSTGKGRKSWQCYFSVCSFTYDDIKNILQPQMTELGIKTSITHGENRYRLRLSSYSIPTLFEYIGRECPVNCYEYKYEFNKKSGTDCPGL